jgi:hypothetical protein
MGSLVVIPKSAEEMQFLVDLLERLGIPAHLLTDEEERDFLSDNELTEAGRDFLESRAQDALKQKDRKTWQVVQSENALKYNWPRT